MKVIEVGNWVIYSGNKFTAYTMHHITKVKLQKILDEAFRKTNYDIPIFFRQKRGGSYVYDHIRGNKVLRTIFDKKMNIISQNELPIHEEIADFADAKEFFMKASISEEPYRHKYASIYFNNSLVKTEKINSYLVKVEGENFSGVMMQHSYTEPFVEYLLKIGKTIIVSDKPLTEIKYDFSVPDPFEIHIIDTKEYQRKMLVARLDDIEIVFPYGTKIGDSVKIPTITEGIVRLIPVKNTNIEEIVQRVTKIADNPRKIYLHENYSVILTDKQRIHVRHKPRVEIQISEL